jgi:uncharacterized protein (TIGR02246 family)
MRRASIFIFSWLVLTGSALAADKTAKDEEAVKATVQGFVDALNKGDGKALAALFTEEGSLVNVFGMEMVGRAAIEQTMTSQLAGPLKGVKSGINPTRVVFVKPDVAIGDADLETSGLKAPDGKPIAPIKSRGTAVFVKQKGKWLFAAARAYVHVPAPAAPKM